MAPIKAVLTQTGRFERIGAHAHFKGLARALGRKTECNQNKGWNGGSRESPRSSRLSRQNDQRR